MPRPESRPSWWPRQIGCGSSQTPRSWEARRWSEFRWPWPHWQTLCRKRPQQPASHSRFVSVSSPLSSNLRCQQVLSSLGHLVIYDPGPTARICLVTYNARKACGATLAYLLCRKVTQFYQVEILTQLYSEGYQWRWSKKPCLTAVRATPAGTNPRINR